MTPVTSPNGPGARSAGLAEVVQRGADTARVVFGCGGEAVPVGRLTEAGSSLYSDGATAGAVGVLMTNDRPTVEVILGAVSTGAQLVSLPLLGRSADPEEFARFVKESCTRHAVDELVVRDDLAEVLDGLGVPTRRHSDLAARPLAAPGDFRLVQFSSGSTRAPKPVVLDDAAIGANVGGLLAAVEPQPGDVAVSWLPLSHDMGLIGMLLTSLAAAAPRWAGGGELVLLDPGEFLRRPSSWLEALDVHRGTFTAAPDFGYRMAVQRPPRRSVDLTALRCAIVGGEIVRADTLAGFVDRFGEAGCEPAALCPAYGLAELGVAATMTRPHLDWRERLVDASALADERLAVPGPGRPAVTLVSSGQPLPGYEVDCSSPAACSDTGTIAVRGPSVGTDGWTGRPFADADGWLRTGDSGFVDEGWLYVCGRGDDVLVVHGRNVYAPAVEAEVGSVDGVRSGRVTAVALANGDWVVVVEPAATPPARLRLREEIRRAAVRAAGASPDDILVVERGTLPLTASGKLQRNEVRARLQRGDLSLAAPLGS